MTAADYLWSLGSANGPLQVVDVGANPIEGDAPYKALLAAGRVRVVGFEPQESALAALNRAKSAAETYLPYALGDGSPGELRLYAQSGFASLYDIDPARAALVGFQRGTAETGRVAVATRRLDDLDEVPPVDFLKIDVQGSELSVIRHGRNKLSDAMMIQAEVRFLPLYLGEPPMGDLVAELAAQGFILHDFAFVKRRPFPSRLSQRLRPRTMRQVIDGDAWFIRDPLGAADWTDAQLWRLGLLADGVAASPSLAIFCIEALEARGAVPAGAADRYVDLLPAEWKREAVHV